MSEVTSKIKNGFNNLGERMSNPLLIKEMYQSLHNRWMQTGLWLLLGILLIGLLMISQNSGESDFGEDVFKFVTISGAIFSLFILPYFSLSDLQEEISSRTFELVSITTLVPDRQVRGRLLAAAVKLGLVYSLILPFIAAAFLFGGIGVEEGVMILGCVAATSIVLSSFAIFLAAAGTQPGSGGATRLIFTIALIGGGIATLAFILEGYMGYGPAPEELGYGFLINLFMLTWLNSSGAANALAYEAGKSSARSKLVLLATVIINMLFFTFVVDEPEAGGILCSVLVSICGIYWLTDTQKLTTKLKRRLKNKNSVYRFVAFSLVDGPGATALFLAVVFGVIHIIGVQSSSAGYDNFLGLLVTLFSSLLYSAAVAHVIMRFIPAKLHFRYLPMGIAGITYIVTMILGIDNFFGISFSIVAPPAALIEMGDHWGRIDNYVSHIIPISIIVGVYFVVRAIKQAKKYNEETST